jgi:2-methylcitrate dehydratase PrpD
MSITRKIVDYTINAKFEDIPSEVLRKTKEFILDEIGNALGGSVLKSGKIIIEWAKLHGGSPESTLISDGTKVPAGIASGVNTQLCMGLEMMETYKNRGHPGSGIVTTSLAIGEREQIGGRELLTSICAAYDITGRLIDATFPSTIHRTKVWNSSWQGCGPLLVAVRLLRLNQEEGMNALGMGLGNAPTMNVHNILYTPASMSKCGNQFHNFVAVNGAILAKLGYTGYYEILDDPYPFWTTISDQNSWEIYTKDLGKSYLILTGMSFKPWPTCRWAQPGIESLLQIMQSEGLKSEDIEEVIYYGHEKITNYPFNNHTPMTPEDAYWSVPWSLGNAALGHKPGPLWYADDLFRDSSLKTFMEKVNLETLPEAVKAFNEEPEKSITRLKVKAKGKITERKTEYCLGDPQMPLTHEKVINKFLQQTENIISPENAERIIYLVDNCEKLEDINELSKLLG